MKDHTGRAGGEEKEEERRKSGCERRAAVTIEVKNDSFGGGVVGWGEVLQKARWKAVPQGLAEAGGGERQGILKIIRIVSAFHLLTHNKKKACTIDWSTPLSCFSGFQKDSLLPC